MDTTLPLLEQALASWRQWPLALTCQPVVCCQLPGGQSNQTFLLAAGNTLLVLRLGLAGAELLGVDRQREHKILLAAAAAGLAPRPLYHQPACDLLVTEYLDGIKPDLNLLATPQWQNALARSLNAMRELSIELGPYPYRQQLDSYWQQLLAAGHPEFEQHYRSAVLALELLQSSNASLAVTHHDLSLNNLLMVEDRLMLLDWEYAGNGYRIMDDLALSQAGVKPPTIHSAEQWAAAQAIHEFLDKGWYLLRQNSNWQRRNQGDTF